MITMARLRPFNKKKGRGMRTYTSSKGNKYSVGIGHQPSPVKIVQDEAELEELREFPQFEIRSFKDRAALDAFLEDEVASIIRSGRQAVKPSVDTVRNRAKGKPASPAKVAAIFGEDDEPETPAEVADSEPVNNGRPPAKTEGDDEERAELVAEVKEMEEKHAEAIEKGRTEATIEKWEGRLNEAVAALYAYDHPDEADDDEADDEDEDEE